VVPEFNLRNTDLRCVVEVTHREREAPTTDADRSCWIPPGTAKGMIIDPVQASHEDVESCRNAK
jgi:hypothetical protein